MYLYERCATKAEAVVFKNRLFDVTGILAKIYKGHRAYVVQWWVD